MNTHTPLVHEFSRGYFAVARCAASPRDDNDAPATHDRAEVTCAACLALPSLPPPAAD